MLTSHTAQWKRREETGGCSETLPGGEKPLAGAVGGSWAEEAEEACTSGGREEEEKPMPARGGAREDRGRSLVSQDMQSAAMRGGGAARVCMCVCVCVCDAQWKRGAEGSSSVPFDSS